MQDEQHDAGIIAASCSEIVDKVAADFGADAFEINNTETGTTKSFKHKSSGSKFRKSSDGRSTDAKKGSEGHLSVTKYLICYPLQYSCIEN